MVQRPTVEECAALLNKMMREYGLQHGKAVSRGRVSAKTLRRVCGRRALRDIFLEDLATALLDWGWVLVIGPTERYGLLAETSLDGWSRVTSAPIADILKQVRRGQYDFDQLDESVDDDVDDDAA